MGHFPRGWGGKKGSEVLRGEQFLLFLLFFFCFTILYWFCHTSAWLHHECTCVPNPEPPSQPPSRHHPSGSSQCTSPKHPVSCIEPGLAIRFLYDIRVSMPFSRIIPPSPSPTESKRLFYTSVSLLVHISFDHFFLILLLPFSPLAPFFAHWGTSHLVGPPKFSDFCWKNVWLKLNP